MIEFRHATISVIVMSTSLFMTFQLGAQEISPDELDFFESRIRPVLVRECYSCHSQQAGQMKGGLQLDTNARMALGGNSGPAVVPGDVDASPLWNAINYEDLAMPPKAPLPPRVIADFRRWIEMGAPDPRQSEVEAVQSTVTAEDIRDGRKFWAYQRPERPTVPGITVQDWARNPIDNFIHAALHANGLSPADDADPNTLLRRMSFDLLGLPPSPEQLASFVDAWKRDPDSAISQAVDQMLDDPGFGERWGRHWLDVARYAESTGRELNATFPNAWRYRDYVIDAFNEDKPYDAFIREQIAGDLLPAATDEEWATHLIATGFLAIGPKSLTEQNARQFELDLVDEQIDVTTRVVLGTSVACARCHDHKFDPIPQQDYYAMAGIFQSTSTHYGTIDTTQNRRPGNQLILPIDDANPFDQSLSSSTIQQLNDELAEKKQQLRELLRARQQARRSEQPNAQSRRSLAELTRVRTRMAFIEAALDSIDPTGHPRSFCMGVQDDDRPANARLLVRGEFDQPADVVERGFVQVLSNRPARIKPANSGRLELANWMTSRRNPLTARVMVNRIWLHLFAEGIVRTPENFGSNGLPPTHPELLDWLAVRFMEEDWSIKQMIRQIVSSRTYRMSSAFDAEKFEIDPDNLYLWRASPRQLDAEALRDAMLAVSGTMDRTRPRASLVAEAGLTVVRDGKLASVSIGQTGTPISMSEGNSSIGSARPRLKLLEIDQIQFVRSVYLPIVRDHLPRALEVFDFAEPGMVVGQRDTSNTPAQGLYLLNNEFVRQQARQMAQRLMNEAGTTSERIQLAFQLAYARNAESDEFQAARQFLDEFPARRNFRNGGASVQENRLIAFAHAILASAEFRYTN